MLKWAVQKFQSGRSQSAKVDGSKILKIENGRPRNTKVDGPNIWKSVSERSWIIKVEPLWIVHFGLDPNVRTCSVFNKPWWSPPYHLNRIYCLDKLSKLGFWHKDKSGIRIRSTYFGFIIAFGLFCAVCFWLVVWFWTFWPYILTRNSNKITRCIFSHLNGGDFDTCSIAFPEI